MNPRECVGIISYLSAIAYPNSNIFVMFLSKTNFVRLKSSLLIEMLKKIKNVHFRYLNISEFARNTPLESWLQSDKLTKSKYLLSHTSDVLRYLTLWKFGGTYLDLDVIVVKSVKISNFACAEDNKVVNGAILGLDKQQGRKIAEMFMK